MATTDTFSLLWETAVKKFEEEHGCKLADIVQTAAGRTPEDILKQANLDFVQFRDKREKLWSKLKPFTDTICGISSVLGHSIKLSFPPAEAIAAGVVVLIKTSERVSENYNAIADLMADLCFLLERTRVYTLFDSSPQVQDLIVDSLAETLTVIRLATRAAAQGRCRAFLHTLFHKDKKIKDALSKLDRLSKREGGATNLATVISTKEILTEIRNGMQLSKGHSDTVQSVLTKVLSIAEDVSIVRTQSQSSMAIVDELRQLSSPILGAIQKHELKKIKPKFNFQAEHDPCLEETRPDILGLIHDWIENVDAPNVFWLYGHPGTGKSAIATTIRHNLAFHRRLGATCFFRREDMDFHKPRDVVLSIASDLATKHDFIGARIIKKLQEGTLDVKDTSLFQLFQALIVETLYEVAPGFNDTVVIVIDAMDEFGGMDHYNDPQFILLNTLIAQWSKLPSCFKLFVTSRDQGYLSDYLKIEPNWCQSLEVGEAATAQASKDIRRFFEVKLSQTAQRRGWVNWIPSAVDLDVLTEAASGLFIWASTIVNLVSRRRSEFDQIVIQVRNGSLVGKTPFAGLERLYQTILETASQNWPVRNLATVCGAIITARVPLSCSALSSLLQSDERDIDDIVSQLRPVLSASSRLHFVHKSFVDYMISDRCPGEFRCVIMIQEQKLLDACFAVMERELHFNMGSMKSSYQLNKDIPTLKEQVSEQVKYGCIYWGSHLEPLGKLIDADMEDAVHRFLEMFLLYWLEVCSITESFDQALLSLAVLARSIGALGGDLARLARDASSFVRAFIVPMSQSYPHIYLSALPFIPQISFVRAQYMKLYSSSIHVPSGLDIYWSPQLGVLRGHEALTTSAAFSPDGTRIVSASEDNTIRLWDAYTLDPVGEPLQGHEGEVMSIAFSPDGKQLVSASYDKTIRLWDATILTLIGEPLRGHDDWITCANFSPDGRWIVSASYDKTIRLWDAATLESVGEPLRGHKGYVTSVAFSPDGARIVSASEDRTIRLWDVATLGPIGEPLRGHERRIRSAVFSPDGRRIVSASNDKTICLWDAATLRSIGVPLRGHRHSVRSAVFSPDGRRIVSASYDQTIRLWDTCTLCPIGEPLRGHEGLVRSVAFSPDGNFIVSTSRDCTVRLWDAQTLDTIGESPQGHERGVTLAAFSPNGKQIVSVSDDKTFRIWNATTLEPTGGLLRGHEDRIISAAFSPDGKKIVSASADRTICIWNAATLEPIGEPLRGHEDVVRSASFSPDGARIVSASDDQTIRLWDAVALEGIGKPLRGHEDWVRSAIFSPDGMQVVSASDDKTVRLWDSTTLEPIGKPLQGHKDWVSLAVFSPDGTRVVSASDDKTIRLWDSATLEPIGKPLRGHEDRINSAAFSPDGKWIVSASNDNIIRIWDSVTLEPVGKPLRGHEGWVMSAVFSPDGKRILSASEDKTIRLWNMDTSLSSGLELVPPLAPSYKKHIGSKGSVPLCLLADGWVINSLTLDRLLWIPHHLHLYIQTPGMIDLIGQRDMVTFDLSSLHHGKSWTKCREACPESS